MCFRPAKPVNSPVVHVHHRSSEGITRQAQLSAGGGASVAERGPVEAPDSRGKVVALLGDAFGATRDEVGTVACDCAIRDVAVPLGDSHILQRTRVQLGLVVVREVCITLSE